MSQALDDQYDRCMDATPHMAHAAGILGSAAAVTGLMAATEVESLAPPAWPLAFVTAAAQGAAADVGHELGQHLGLLAAEGFCAFGNSANTAIENSVNALHDYLSGPPPALPPQAPPQPDWYTAPAPSPDLASYPSFDSGVPDSGSAGTSSDTSSFSGDSIG